MVASSQIETPLPSLVPLPSFVRAVIFDVDGTLYDQRKLRRAMAVELLAFLACNPVRGWSQLKLIRCVRHAQERLRSEANHEGRPLGDLQLALAAEASGWPLDAARPVIEDWMFSRPLPQVRRAAFGGLRDVLAGLRGRGLRLGVYSDYPAERKLEALGVADCFDAVVSSYDVGVHRFKPDPMGFRVAAERLGISAEETVYVGDRAEVDAVGALAAGMGAILLQPRNVQPRPARWTIIDSLGRLLD